MSNNHLTSTETAKFLGIQVRQLDQIPQLIPVSHFYNRWGIKCRLFDLDEVEQLIDSPLITALKYPNMTPKKNIKKLFRRKKK